MKFSDALIWCMATERNSNDISGIYGFTQKNICHFFKKGTDRR